MKTRWSTVLAALCLTLMALGSGRAAPSVISVTGAGTVASPVFGTLHFSVEAQSDKGGHVSVSYGSGLGLVHYAVRSVFPLVFNQVLLSAVVTHSTDESRFPVGRTDEFTFQDTRARIGGIAWSGLNDGGTLHPLTNGRIKVTP
jgi:hypothetical protein